MAKARLLSANVTPESATTLTASSEATGYPATNLKNNKRGLPWRSTSSTGNQTLEAAFSSRTVRAVAILNYRAHTGGGVIALEADTGSGYSPVGNFTLTPVRTNLSVLYMNLTTCIKLRITFSNGGAVNTYVELGGLFIADSAGYYEMPVNVTDQLGYDPVDPSQAARTLGGQKFFNTRAHWLRIRSRCEHVSAAQKDAFLAVRDTVGKRTPVIFAVDPDDFAKTVFGQFAGEVFPAEHGQRDRWHLDTTIEEAL